MGQHFCELDVFLAVVVEHMDVFVVFIQRDAISAVVIVFLFVSVDFAFVALLILAVVFCVGRHVYIICKYNVGVSLSYI